MKDSQDSQPHTHTPYVSRRLIGCGSGAVANVDKCGVDATDNPALYLRLSASAVHLLLGSAITSQEYWMTNMLVLVPKVLNRRHLNSRSDNEESIVKKEVTLPLAMLSVECWCFNSPFWNNSSNIKFCPRFFGFRQSQ